ncbi:hypothetical protein [Salinibaculum salinum]|uniref:hypothetical protein n=1 Tax=Salinibaculum salinum TaxID=3131996 RepID=UPI0030EE47FD
MIEKDTNGAGPCKDIETADLFEQNLAPEVYHDLTEVRRDVVTDLSFCEIEFIEEECSRCGTRIPGLMINGDPPKSLQEFKIMLHNVYEPFYGNPRSVEYVDMDTRLAESSPEATIEIFKSVMFAAALGSEDAENETGKRSKQALWTQILGPEYTDDD